MYVASDQSAFEPFIFTLFACSDSMHTPIGCYPGSAHRLESQLTPKLLQHRASDTHGTHTRVRHGREDAAMTSPRRQKLLSDAS